MVLGSLADNRIVLTYDEALDTGSVPATGDFALAGVSVPITSVSVQGSTVWLILPDNIPDNYTLTLSYTAGTNPIRDLAGNNAANFVTQAVTNSSSDHADVVLSVVYTATQFVFKWKAAAGNDVSFHEGDGTVQTVSGNDAALVTTTFSHSGAGTYDVWLSGDDTAITYIDVSSQAFVSGNAAGWKTYMSGLTGLFIFDTLVTGAYTLEYQVVYTALTTPPADAIAKEQDAMVGKLVLAGVWTKLDLFYLFAQTTNGAAEALKNWVNPATFAATLVNGPAFTALEGFMGGNTLSINTNYHLINNATNYATLSASVGCYIRTNLQAGTAVFGASTGAATYLYPWHTTSTQTYQRINDATYLNVAVTDSLGMYIINRVNATTSELFKNKVKSSGNANASAGPPSTNMFVLAYSNNGTAAGFSAHQLSMFFVGSGFTQQNATDMTDAVETYMDSNAKGVVA